MVLDGPFLASGDENEFVNTRSYRLFDGILNQWLVYDGEHFFWARLGGGKESGSEPRDGKDGLFDDCARLDHG